MTALPSPPRQRSDNSHRRKHRPEPHTADSTKSSSKIAGSWIAPERHLHPQGKPVHAVPHVCVAPPNSELNAHARRYLDHRRRIR